MRSEKYKGCEIRSNPNEIIGYDEYKYATEGIIVVDVGSSVTHILSQNLNIPDKEHKHKTESNADDTFILYAKNYIDNLFKE